MAANKFSDFLAQLQAQQDPMMSQMSDQTPMPEEQNQMLSQMGAQQRMPQGQPIPPPTPVMAPPTPQQTSATMMRKTAGVNPADLLAYQSKLNDYNNQYKDQLGKLQGYMQDYRTTEQPTDYRPIAAFLGGLPQNKNTQLLEAANAMAPESKAKQQQNAIANQQTYTKDIGEMAKNSDYVKMLNGQMQQQNNMLRNQMMSNRNALGQQRLTFQEEKEARGTVNNDPMLKQYAPRLEGAAKIQELIEAAHSGKVVSNQALLGQLNAEIARLETGSQAPGLHAAEKTELNQYAAQLGAVRDAITGNPTDSVDPRILNTAGKMVTELSGSYMKGIDSRADMLAGGMRDNQRGIVDEKLNSIRKTYAPRFGGWNGLVQTKYYQGKNYVMQGDHWVEVP